MFQIAPADGDFIDFVLSDDYGCDAAEYGKTRALTENEKRKYGPVWEQIIPNIDMNRVRLVEFCWYNCCEAPGYYDNIDDPFYTEEI